jgi:hypothetical protein
MAPSLALVVSVRQPLSSCGMHYGAGVDGAGNGLESLIMNLVFPLFSLYTSTLPAILQSNR